MVNDSTRGIQVSLLSQISIRSSALAISIVMSNHKKRKEELQGRMETDE